MAFQPDVNQERGVWGLPPQDWKSRLPAVHSSNPFFFSNWARLGSSTCPLTSFFWLLIHVIYLKQTKVLQERILSKRKHRRVAELFLTHNKWGLNFLQNECSQNHLSPEKLRKMFTFQFCKFLNDEIGQKIVKCHTLSDTHYDWREIKPVSMKANFIQFWCVVFEFIVKNQFHNWTSELRCN